MRSKTLWLASLATASLCAPAIASAESGLFVGGSIGSTTIDETFDGIDLDADATAYRIVGGFQFSDLFGVEVGYQDFGNIDENIVVGPVSSLTRISADGWTLGGTLGLPVSDNFSIIGRAGVFFWDADVSVDGFSIDTPGDENPYYGAGARLDVSDSFSLIGDWSRFELDDVDTDVISIGFQYRF
ncbi:MAG: porin family protein [Woeseiaceae bacterium]|nr:porin family protein [Woeseiaceae bacterium]